MTVGDQLAIYRPPYSVIANGWQLNLLVNLGRAEKFVRFNEESVVFSTKPEMVEDVDIGEHEIRITATFT